MTREEQIVRLHAVLAPRVLRRSKGDIRMGLPQKHEAIVRVDLSAEQRELYKIILARNYGVSSFCQISSKLCENGQCLIFVYLWNGGFFFLILGFAQSFGAWKCIFVEHRLGAQEVLQPPCSLRGLS